MPEFGKYSLGQMETFIYLSLFSSFLSVTEILYLLVYVYV